MKNKLVSVLFFVALLFCLLCSGFTGNFKTVLGDSPSGRTNSDANSWPMFRNDLAHSGYSTSSGPLTNQTLWSYKTAPILSSPTVASGIVYVGSNNGKVFALNASNGAVLWSYQTGGEVYSSPALADGVVYFGSWDKCIYALNALTGAMLWSYQTGSYVQSSPTVANGIVYVASYDASVYALDAATGRVLWTYQTGSGAVGSSPAVWDGLVYIGDNGGRVYALNASTGVMLWRFTAGDTIYSSPAIVDGVVYIGADLSVNGNVYALNASTGAKLWSYQTGNLWVYSSPAVANGVVYVGSNDHLASSGGNLFALNASSGELLWSYATGGEIFSSPAVANGAVYIGGGDHNVYAFNASSGAVLWSYQTGNSVYWSSPAVADGILYVGSDDGTLYAFGSSTSTPTSTPTPPTAILNSTATVPAITDSGRTVNLTIGGNITSSQMSNVTIALGTSNDTVNVSFTLTGESGSIGFSNITISKSEVPYGTTPIVYIDGQPAENQGYNQDTNNYYVWYTTHFSTHKISILFTTASSSPSPTALQGQTGKSSWLQVIYGVAAAIAVVSIVVVALELVTRERKSKSSIEHQ